jgi:hypothetical protein
MVPVSGVPSGRRVSTQAWIFLVGLRVLDLAALAAWLVWFFTLRNEPEDGEDDGGGGGGPGTDPPEPSGAPRGGIPLPDAGPWPVRLRDHTSRRPRRAPIRAPSRHRAPAHRRPVHR